MRSIAHWSGQYVRDRLALYIYEWTHRDCPWLAPEATEYVSRFVTGEMQYFEWGAGRSTVWFGRRVESVVSVEHNPAWHQRVVQTMQEATLNNVSLVLANTSREEYIQPIRDASDGAFDIVLVDGLSELRDECALAAIPKVRMGGILIVDDIHRYLPSSSPIAECIAAIRRTCNGRVETFSVANSTLGIAPLLIRRHGYAGSRPA